MMGQHKHNPTAIAAANGMLHLNLRNLINEKVKDF